MIGRENKNKHTRVVNIPLPVIQILIPIPLELIPTRAHSDSYSDFRVFENTYYVIGKGINSG